MFGCLSARMPSYASWNAFLPHHHNTIQKLGPAIYPWLRTQPNINRTRPHRVLKPKSPHIRANNPYQAQQQPTTMNRLTTTLLTLAATAAAQAAYPAGNMTTHIMPMNCTSACTTVIEPCTESAPMPYGTGSWTPTPMPPPPTGGYTPPPPVTWSPPSQPSTTSEPPASSPPMRYTGAASRLEMAGGLVLAALGLAPALV